MIDAADPYAAGELVAVALCATAGTYLVLAARRHPDHEWLALALGALTGASYFVVALGLRMADPRQVGWITGDWMTHFLGWHVFRHEPWTLPPGRIVSLAHPVGTSIGYTDSIPIAALLFKPFDWLLPADFQYLGLWLLSAFVLQGAAGAALAGVATRRLSVRMAGAALAVLSPILLWRVGHPALAAHWQILAALWLNLRPPDIGSGRRDIVWWTSLAGVSAATHPYLTAMVLVLAGAFLAREAWHGRLTPARAAAGMSVVLLAVVSVWWACGYLLLGAGDVGAEGIDLFSMNLLAYVLPMGDASAFLPALEPARSGQYEGFNYLGLGVLLLASLATALAIAGRARRDPLPDLRAVAIAALALAAFALSPTITLGSRVLVELPTAPWDALSAFRATGRFGWPLHYLILFLALAGVARGLPSRGAASIVAIALVVQVADLYPHPANLAAARQAPVNYTWVNRFFSDFWTRVPPAYRHLVLYPSNLCQETAASARDHLVYLAGRHGLTINAASLARFSPARFSRYCAELEARMHDGLLADDSLYIVAPDRAAALVDRSDRPAACVRVDGMDVCTTLAAASLWRRSWPDERREHGPYGWTYRASATRVPIDRGEREMAAFAGRIEAAYRDGLGRRPAPVAIPLTGASLAIADYLGYRALGCSAGQAARRASANAAGFPAPPCPPAGGAAAIDPGREEALAFRRSLEGLARELMFEPGESAVDLEGQAAWVSEYLVLRSRGCAPSGATETIVGEITGRPPAADCAAGRTSGAGAR